MTDLASLRRDAPDWEWRAQRQGFGWSYVGTCHWEEVRVSAYSVLCGPSDDDFCTEWRADNGETSRSLSTWLLLHSVAYDQARAEVPVEKNE